MLRNYIYDLRSIFTSPFTFFKNMKEKGTSGGFLFFAAFTLIVSEFVTADNFGMMRFSPGGAVREMLITVASRLLLIITSAGFLFMLLRIFREKARFSIVLKAFSFAAAFVLTLSLINSFDLAIEFIIPFKSFAYTATVILKILIYSLMVALVITAVRAHTGIKWPKLSVLLVLYAVFMGLILFVLSFAGFALKIAVLTMLI
jgi:hypothetical protein